MANIGGKSQGKMDRHYKYNYYIITMKAREKCVTAQGGKRGFYLTIPQIAGFIVCSVDGKRTK
jgi:hypothetical protein